MIDRELVDRKVVRIAPDLAELRALVETGHPPPKDYFDSFVALGGLALPKEFATRIASAAGLRNRIAHEYDELDPARLFEGMAAAVRDIPAHLGHVEEYLGLLA